MCTYSRYSSTVQTRGVWRPLLVVELMLLTSGASVISCVYSTRHERWKSDAGPANRQPLTSSRHSTRRLRLFGHNARAGPSQDHSRALRAAISRLPVDWHRPPGRPRRTWLWTIELDLQQHNLGLNSARKRAQDRSKWWKLVETAMSCQGRATRWWWWINRAKLNSVSLGVSELQVAENRYLPLTGVITLTTVYALMWCATVTLWLTENLPLKKFSVVGWYY